MDIIMFGFNDWREWEGDDFRTRSAIIAKKLAEHANVRRMLVVARGRSICISMLRGLRSSVKNTRDRGAAAGLHSVAKVSEKVFVLDHTRLFPREESYRLFYGLNGVIHDEYLRRAIRGLARDLEMYEPVLWVSNPLMAKHIGTLDETVSIFDAIDDWSCHPQKLRMRRSIEHGYSLVLQRAGIIFTVSRALAKRFGENRSNVHWQPNGVEFARFDSDGEVMPSDVALLQRPIVGYVGLLQERIDVDMLRALAERMPHASIVLIGRMVAKRHFAKLYGAPNIHFLGKKPYGMIPVYLNAFDVCIVPHVEGAFSSSMNPLKVYEYLAAGKPVVASGLEDFDEAGDLICNVKCLDEFVAAVQRSATACDSVAGLRRRFAKRHSWDRRVEEMLSIVGGRLGRSRGARSAA